MIATLVPTLISLLCSVILPLIIVHVNHRIAEKPHYIFLLDASVKNDQLQKELFDKAYCVNSFSNAVLFWRRGYNVVYRVKTLDHLDTLPRKYRKVLVLICDEVPGSIAGINIFKSTDVMLNDLISDLTADSVKGTVDPNLVK